MGIAGGVLNVLLAIYSYFQGEITEANVFNFLSDGQKVVKAAFKHYEEKSCIRFRLKRPEDKDYLYFHNGEG